MAYPSLSRQFHGFSLIESITVVAVLVITTGIALPSYEYLLSRNRQTTSINQFSTILAQARYHAVNHLSRVVLCPSTNHQDCTGGFEWHSGYIAFTDNNMDKQRNAGEKIISVVEKAHGSVSIKTSSGRRKIIFRPSGRSPGSNTTVLFCTNQGSLPGKALILSNSGRARLSKKLANDENIPCQLG